MTLPVLDDAEITVPADPTTRLLGISYAVQRLVRLASADPGVLADIDEDLAEAFLLVVPAVEHVETALEVATDAA